MVSLARVVVLCKKWANTQRASKSAITKEVWVGGSNWFRKALTETVQFKRTVCQKRNKKPQLHLDRNWGELNSWNRGTEQREPSQFRKSQEVNKETSHGRKLRKRENGTHEPTSDKVPSANWTPRTASVKGSPYMLPLLSIKKTISRPNNPGGSVGGVRNKQKVPRWS
jgi:hypothetical protein